MRNLIFSVNNETYLVKVCKIGWSYGNIKFENGRIEFDLNENLTFLKIQKGKLRNVEYSLKNNRVSVESKYLFLQKSDILNLQISTPLRLYKVLTDFDIDLSLLKASVWLINYQHKQINEVY